MIKVDLSKRLHLIKNIYGNVFFPIGSFIHHLITRIKSVNSAEYDFRYLLLIHRIESIRVANPISLIYRSIRDCKYEVNFSRSNPFDLYGIGNLWDGWEEFSVLFGEAFVLSSLCVREEALYYIKNTFRLTGL